MKLHKNNKISLTVLIVWVGLYNLIIKLLSNLISIKGIDVSHTSYMSRLELYLKTVLLQRIQKYILRVIPNTSKLIYTEWILLNVDKRGLTWDGIEWKFTSPKFFNFIEKCFYYIDIYVTANRISPKRLSQVFVRVVVIS